MVDNKIFVYNAARDNNVAALKVSVLTSLMFYLHHFCVCILCTLILSRSTSVCFFCLFSSFCYNLFSQQRRFFSRLKQLKLNLISFVIRFDLNFVRFPFPLTICSFILSRSSLWRSNESTRCRSTYHFDKYNENTKYHYILIIVRPCADVLFVFGCYTPFDCCFIRNVKYKHV